jgi:hypothetical protein
MQSVGPFENSRGFIERQRLQNPLFGGFGGFVDALDSDIDCAMQCVCTCCTTYGPTGNGTITLIGPQRGQRICAAELTRSVSEGVKPSPRLHLRLVWDVSSLTARSIIPSAATPLIDRNAPATSARKLHLPSPKSTIDTNRYAHSTSACRLHNRKIESAVCQYWY